jgi:hypothetical protein
MFLTHETKLKRPLIKLDQYCLVFDLKSKKSIKDRKDLLTWLNQSLLNTWSRSCIIGMRPNTKVAIEEFRIETDPDFIWLKE